ncbi:MAG: hypothetical protein R3C61_27910 [Bacteroidia bacterium]
MEKTSIENIISGFGDRLDVYQPPDGHIGRFGQKLRRRKNKNLRFYLRIAAAVTVLAAVAGTALLIRDNQPEPVTQWEAELNDLDVYYTTLYQQELDRLGNYNLAEYEFARQLKEDLDQIEASNAKFRKMILEQGENQYLLDAMIENYQMKLKILQKLKKLIDKTEKSHEIKPHHL